MNRIRFEVRHRAIYPEDEMVSEVAIFIDGQDLLELVREAELPFARHEGHPDLAGGYVGLSPAKVFLPSRHLLGSPDQPHLDEDSSRTMIYGCPCGEPGCWPLLARIDVGPVNVRWSDFRNPHRAAASTVGVQEGRTEIWSDAGLRPFEFELRQYEDALKADSQT
jgi:hypothetical protein